MQVEAVRFMKIKEVEIEAVRFVKNKVDSRGGPLGVTRKRRLALDGGWLQRVPFAVTGVPSCLIPYRGAIVIPEPVRPSAANGPDPAKAGEGALQKLTLQLGSRQEHEQCGVGR